MRRCLFVPFRDAKSIFLYPRVPLAFGSLHPRLLSLSPSGTGKTLSDSPRGRENDIGKIRLDSIVLIFFLGHLAFEFGF